MLQVVMFCLALMVTYPLPARAEAPPSAQDELLIDFGDGSEPDQDPTPVSAPPEPASAPEESTAPTQPDEPKSLSNLMKQKRAVSARKKTGSKVQARIASRESAPVASSSSSADNSYRPLMERGSRIRQGAPSYKPEDPN